MERRRISETRTLALTAEQVRERIVDEHQRLRRLLVDVQGLARGVALESTMLPALRSALHVLLVEFALHIESEERILLPLLERDESGSAQADSLRRDHERQRNQLRAMFAKIDADASEAAWLAEATDGFVLSVLRDMRDEEVELLGAPASLRQSSAG
jgi:iron-sulfur cluster repair protein YtfE (RIC family)